MKIVPIIFFVVCFLFQICNAQQAVKKELSLKTVSSATNKQKTNLILVHKDERTFEIPDSLDQYDYFVFKNELKNHLTKIGEREEQYWNQIPILLCYNKKKIILSLDTDHNNSFEGEEFFMSNNLDTKFHVNFIFKHKIDREKDISIPVNLKVLYSDMFIRLSMQYDVFFSTDAEELDGSKNKINVFPFTGMARYEVENKEAGNTEIYFNDELIDINGIYWRVGKLDYPLKEIWIDSIGVVERPVGFRVDQYLEEEIVRKAFGNLSVNSKQIDFSKEYTLLHFWGEWCPPCLEELPRLKKLLHRIDGKKVNVVHVSFLPDKSDRVKTIEFINTSDLEGTHLLDDASAEYSLVQMLNNRTFPGYVIFDANFKIVYRSDDKELNLPSFLKSKGLL